VAVGEFGFFSKDPFYSFFYLHINALSGLVFR
jgi:hypothetical protein